MLFIVISLIFLLALAGIAIGLLIWCVRGLLKRLLRISQNLQVLYGRLDDFSQHVEHVYGLETFYGDSTLHKLLEHSRLIVKELEEFDDFVKEVGDTTYTNLRAPLPEEEPPSLEIPEEEGDIPPNDNDKRDRREPARFDINRPAFEQIQQRVHEYQEEQPPDKNFLIKRPNENIRHQ